MKQTYLLISTLLLVPILFLANGFTQDYIHYATLTGHTKDVNDVSFSPDGRTIASGSRDGTIRLWETDTGKHIKTLEKALPDDFLDQPPITDSDKRGYGDAIVSVSFNPDGSTLVSGSWDGTVRLWDVATGHHKNTLKGHTKVIVSVVFSPDGLTLASGSWDGTVRLWMLLQENKRKNS